jgi:uncharacterized membrane protein
MRIKFFLIVLSMFLLPAAVSAQDFSEVNPDIIPAEEFYRAEVVEILRDEVDESGGNQIRNQLVKIRFLSGPEQGQEMEIENSGVFTINGGNGVEIGDKVIVYKITSEGNSNYYIADTYRLPSIIWIVIAFFAAAIVFARWKGLTSIIGLAVSVLVIAKFVVPQIIAGRNPMLISLLGALVIALVSIYLSHGFNRRTTIALSGTLITLAFAAVLSYIFVWGTKLFGLGSEESFYLQFGSLGSLNLQGLLMGGIILGALGVLDDITTSQSAAVEELKRANPTFNFKELYQRGTSIGREHIASLVNTLFLAYAGASLPLFLFFTTMNAGQPLWVTLNAEFIAEEIVRTLVGSTALILAVPITTFLAARYFAAHEPSAGPANRPDIH